MEINDEYGRYYMLNDMPVHLMALMIRSFKPDSFDTIFQKRVNSISGAGFENVGHKRGNTRYWMFDYELNKQVSWENNKHLTKNDVDTLQILANALQAGMNVVRNENIEYGVFIPGLLKTITQTHQDLHLDCPRPNFDILKWIVIVIFFFFKTDVLFYCST